MDNNEIMRRFDQVNSSRQVVQAEWDIIERFVAPYRGRFFKDQTNEAGIEWRKREVYDSTAINAAQSLAASLHGSLTSPATKWFSLEFRADELNDDLAAKEWLEECGKRVFDALQDSNFNLEANETYLDLVTFGTAAILEEERTQKPGEYAGLDFTAVPIKECFFEPGERGIRVFYRRMYWEASRILDKFGEDNVPDIVKEHVDKGSLDKLKVIFCIYPRRKNASQNTGKALAPSRRPFGFKYVLCPSGDLLGKEGGYYEMPAFLPRWRKTSESMWGNSPANIALADVLTANQMVEMLLKSTEKLIDPPQKVAERALIGDLDLSARGLTVMRDINQIEPLLTGARTDLGELRLDDLRRSIRQYFFVDELELKESPAMTATEVQVRYELMQRLLGPTLGRLQSDFLDPVVERTFNILFRAGQLPPPPQVVIEAGAEMDVNYTGPMTRAQKADQVAAVERWMMLLGNFAEVMPEMLDIPDPDAIAKVTAQMLSVPAKMLRTGGEVSQMRKQRQEAMQRQQQAETAQAEGQAMESMAKAEQMQGAA